MYNTTCIGDTALVQVDGGFQSGEVSMVSLRGVNVSLTKHDEVYGGKKHYVQFVKWCNVRQVTKKCPDIADMIMQMGREGWRWKCSDGHGVKGAEFTIVMFRRPEHRLYGYGSKPEEAMAMLLSNIVQRQQEVAQQEKEKEEDDKRQARERSEAEGEGEGDSGGRTKRSVPNNVSGEDVSRRRDDG